MTRRQRTILRAAVVVLAPWIASESSFAADWPTHGGDNRRSGVTEQRLSLPLSTAWAHRTYAPRPAWPEPARQDLFHEKGPLTPSITFDRVSHVAVAGGAVFFGSSAADKITCLDAATGQLRWSFFTEGPVRLAPSVAAGKVYAGSDDGEVYCLAAGDGKLLWRYRPGPEDRRVPGNGRMISAWPIRSGIVVEGGTVYFCAGLFPTYGVYLCALGADDGAELFKQKVSGVSPQGYMLASDTRLYVPSGRTSPAMFDRRNGRSLGTLHGNQRGGSYALLAGDVVVYRGEEEGSLAVTDRHRQERLVLFRGSHLVTRGEMAFLHSDRELSALNRARLLELARQRNELAAQKGVLEKQLKALKKDPDPAQAKTVTAELTNIKTLLAEVNAAMNACWIWKQPCAYPHALILAGVEPWRAKLDVLLAGGDGEVAAMSTADGKILWKAKVSGKAYGLAVADGRLFVSTDQGAIHCFQ